MKITMVLINLLFNILFMKDWHFLFICIWNLYLIIYFEFIMGIGDWGLGIDDWGESSIADGGGGIPDPEDPSG